MSSIEADREPFEAVAAALKDIRGLPPMPLHITRQTGSVGGFEGIVFTERVVPQGRRCSW